jgi:hypothetical protein
VSTQFILPVGMPMSNCAVVMLDGSILTGGAFAMRSDMVLAYSIDTPSPALGLVVNWFGGRAIAQDRAAEIRILPGQFNRLRRAAVACDRDRIVGLCARRSLSACPGGLPDGFDVELDPGQCFRRVPDQLCRGWPHRGTGRLRGVERASHYFPAPVHRLGAANDLPQSLVAGPTSIGTPSY